RRQVQEELPPQHADPGVRGGARDDSVTEAHPLPQYQPEPDPTPGGPMRVYFLACVMLCIGCTETQDLGGQSGGAGGAGSSSTSAQGGSGAGGMCLADDAQCVSDADCCSQSCVNGVCGGSSCQQDGSPCMTSADCCSQQCVQGVCGGGIC